MRSLRLVRLQLRNLFNRCNKDVSSITSVAVSILLEDLSAAYHNYMEAISKAEVADEEKKQIDNEIEQIEEQYFEAREILRPISQSVIDQKNIDEDQSDLKQFLAEQKTLIATLASKVSSTTNNSASGTQLDDSIRLPVMHIPKFNGNLKEWVIFHDLFRSTVHENANISSVQRFQYLKSLLQGEAASLIAGIPTTAENYGIDWRKLEDRYNRPYLVVHSVIQRFFDSETVSSNLSNIREVRNLFNETVQLLDTRGNYAKSRDPWLIFFMTEKLDKNSKRLWAEKISSEDEPSLQLFFSFLNERCAALDLYRPESTPIPFKKDKRAEIQINSTFTSKCFYCQKPHSIYKCPDFLNLTLSDREKFLFKESRCLNCLSKHHNIKSCNSTHNCHHCGKKHNSLLHNSEKPSEIKQVYSTYQNVISCILPTAKILVKTFNGKLVEFRALLDSGSEANLISEAAFSKLGIGRTQSRVPFAWIGNRTQSYSKGRGSFRIQSATEEDFSIDITAHIMSNLIDNLPSENVDVQNLTLIKDSFALADDHFFVSSEIQIILGASTFFECLKPNRYYCERDGLHIQNTHLGHIICSREMGEIQETVRSCCTLSNVSCELNEAENLENLVREFWNLEEPPNKFNTLTDPENDCETNYQKTTYRLPNGKFSVALPFKNPRINIGHSYNQALQRFHTLERKLHENSELRSEYLKFMHEYEALGHMSKSTLTNKDLVYGQYYVIPHHGIWQRGKKLRVVFDASAKSSNGVSLNDALHSGPILQKNIIDILNNFRCFRFVATADIEKMYRQISVHSSDHKFQMICWRFSQDQPISLYYLKTVTYGLNCSPFLALRTIQELVDQEGKLYPHASRFLSNSTYVDDIFFGSNNLDELISIRNEIIELLNRGMFVLRKWSANNKKALEGIPSTDLVSPLLFTSEEKICTKALGISWSPIDDIFQFKFSPVNFKCFSKRNLLSELARFFDPFGWISPVILQLKLLFQTTWALKIDWDTPLPEDIINQWLLIRNDLLCLSSVSIPRFLGEGKVQLHGFADASKFAYGAVIYARIISKEQKNTTRLIISKTKLAPLKPLSIPRLELCAAHLLAKLINSCKMIPYNSVHLWSDSTTVLAWLKSIPKKWNVFVQNRVSNIHELCPNAQWSYIQSKDNPADVASRGISVSKLLDHQLWWSGPKFLEDSTLKVTDSIFATEEELAPQKVYSISISSQFWRETISRFSKFNRLIRSMAYILRLKIRLKNPGTSFDPSLSASEVESSLFLLIKNVQQIQFSNEIQQLTSKKKVLKSSPIYSLSVFLDEDGLLRVGGRLTQTIDKQFNPHPILLPKCHFSELLIRKVHLENYHAGFSLMCAQLRRKFWILGMSKSVKTLLRTCVICNRFNANPYSPSMSSLPSYRLTEAKPFFTTGLDFAGPFSLRAFKHRGNLSTKGYIAVFICMVTKAFHLELIMSLSASSLVMGLNRFLTRRGKCKTMLSDNGRNFVACSSALKNFKGDTLKIKDDLELKNFLSDQFIEWKFIPPYTPHFGGLWESGVKNVKRHLLRSFPNTVFTIEEFTTVLCQIEGILNSRPISPITFSEPHTFISPAHLLIQGDPSQFPESFTSNDTLNVHSDPLDKRRTSTLNNIVASFWSKWRNEYLDTLMRKPKWVNNGKSPSVGDVVAVKRPFQPPALWVLGKIIRLIPNKDHQTRVVQIQTKAGIHTEAVRNLVPLHVNETINGGSMVE